MELLSLPRCEAAKAPPSCVAALGFFDGVHKAHAAVLAEAARAAEERGLPLLVFTFSEKDAPKSGPLLSSDGERAAAFSSLGASYVCFARFSELSGLSPRAFVRDVLVGALHAAFAVAGEDFRFGHRAEGGMRELSALLREAGGEAIFVPPIFAGGEKLSSTRIRALLREGDCEGAAALCGRYYSLTMRVSRGEARGHALGFPTANCLPPEGRLIPADGVYATRVTLPDGRTLTGVSDIGVRPTVAGRERRIETHILDFSGDLYGKTVTVAFCKRLREERRFSELSDLVGQIRRDCEEVRLWSIHNGHS